VAGEEPQQEETQEDQQQGHQKEQKLDQVQPIESQEQQSAQQDGDSGESQEHEVALQQQQQPEDPLVQPEQRPEQQQEDVPVENQIVAVVAATVADQQPAPENIFGDSMPVAVAVVPPKRPSLADILSDTGLGHAYDEVCDTFRMCFFPLYFRSNSYRAFLFFFFRFDSRWRRAIYALV
jgi:hypothetical protein